jgi:hypothetical protein
LRGRRCTTQKPHRCHPKLAVVFARWLDVQFSVWCDLQIDKLLRGEAPAVSPALLITEQRHKHCL